MTALDQQPPWWELPAVSPDEPQYERERERLRAELARAWRARDGRDRYHEQASGRFPAPPAAA